MIKRKKIIAGGVAATIFLGAIGSGVWDYILKPFFNITSEIGLNIISFGINVFKDQIYIEIAKNHHEKISLEILLTFSGLFAGFVLLTCIAALLDNKIEKYLKKKINEIKKDTNKKNKIYFKIFVSFYLIFAVSYILGEALRTEYINESIAKYNQLVTSTKPYLNDNQYDSFNSSFSLIKNKNDYDSIMNELVKIAENNNLDIKHLKLNKK